ncbi:hypothetical protein VT84_31635 [Gemmata sp. SH-PL17]|uniref:hypothetical protein n=1 Tax=Gemmata sp. SH-PL17 TaxID=1630693 RepID=UPI00078BA0E4|nr:hypothetical protein [Gemmata sp. SH-PL17]AMV28989.1 hypothetical protein VT84_31635 [Gemmata sp. SH-PL17]
MRTAFLVLLGCAALDLIAIVVLLSIVWVLHRQMRKEAAARGEVIVSAASQFGYVFAGLMLLLALCCGLAAALVL